MNKPSLGTQQKSICLVMNKKDAADEPKTVVVLGVERGGTSMAAGIIRALGVNMGKRAGLNHEDPLFLTEEHDRLVKRIKMRNKEEDTWGFKVPKASLHLEFYEQHLRNPYYVVVYRNSLAVADSWIQRGAGTMLDVLERISQYHGAILDHARSTKSPVLMLNYERAVQNETNKDLVVAELADFLGLALDKDLKTRASAMMTGDGKGYVNLPEHFFVATPHETSDWGESLALTEASPETRTPDGWHEHNKGRPQLIYKLADGQNLPKKFWVELDLDVTDDLDLAGTPIRMFFNFTGDYFPGHCTRPLLKRGRNMLYVETSGNATDFAFGPLSVPMSFKIHAQTYAANADAPPVSPTEKDAQVVGAIALPDQRPSLLKKIIKKAKVNGS